MQANASYQNATYMNTFKCIRMHLYAAREKCNRRKCNENVENALKCTKMHKNAYPDMGKNPTTFGKTPRIPPGISVSPTKWRRFQEHPSKLSRHSRQGQHTQGQHTLVCSADFQRNRDIISTIAPHPHRRQSRIVVNHTLQKAAASMPALLALPAESSVGQLAPSAHRVFLRLCGGHPHENGCRSQ